MDKEYIIKEWIKKLIRKQEEIKDIDTEIETSNYCFSFEGLKESESTKVIGSEEPAIGLIDFCLFTSSRYILSTGHDRSIGGRIIGPCVMAFIDNPSEAELRARLDQSIEFKNLYIKAYTPSNSGATDLINIGPYVVARFKVLGIEDTFRPVNKEGEVGGVAKTNQSITTNK